MRKRSIFMLALACCFLLPAVNGQVIINEVDADTSGTDTEEFIELYDGGVGNTDLTGLVVVGFNGSDDASYIAWDLDGYSTDVNGYFVMGNTGLAGINYDIGANNAIQNGADAIALFTGDETDFPDDTPVTTTNLIDAIVYDTDDGDDTGLLVLLNPGQPQVNENMNGNKDIESMSRCPNGSGGAQNTSAYLTDTPSLGADNPCTAPTPAPTNTPGGNPTIADIQGMGPASPYVGQTVTVTGICYAMQDTESQAFIADAVGGWNGIMLYESAGWSTSTIAIGDEVEVTADVAEYYNMTELTNCSVTVLSSGNTPYAPTLITTNAANDEQYEGVYLRFENVTVTDVDATYGEWDIDDGSGPVVINDNFNYTYVPVLNDTFDWIQGGLTYSFGEYKLEVCGDSEMQINSSGPTPTPAPTSTPIPPTPVTIYDIQYTIDPSGDSPYNGDIVEFDGVITAFEEGKTKMWVQDGTGPWNGVLIYEGYPGHTGYTIGDAVTVYGTVEEYNNTTEITDTAITVTGTGTLPAPIVLTTLAANDEQYEGCLIEVQNVTVASVTGAHPSGSPWEVDDGSGLLEGWSYFFAIHYFPTVGDTHGYIRGVVDYYSGRYEILPRNDADFEGYVPPPIPTTSHVGLMILLLAIGSIIAIATIKRS